MASDQKLDEFDINKHAYLKQPWVWKVPGVQPVGPQVYIPEEKKESEELTPELLAELKSVFPDYNWDVVHKIAPLTDEQVVQIDGQNADSINKIDDVLEPVLDGALDLVDQQVEELEQEISVERPGDYLDDEGYITKPDSTQIKMVYVQNSEQRDGTQWNKSDRTGTE